jgi:lysophospholipase L1-like esterase
MINKINNQTKIDEIYAAETAQFIPIFNEFKVTFPTEETNIQLIEQVNLMTPENIHLNSFMYEPILDMSNEHLKALYRDIDLLQS